jgi:hypothetical protein
VTREYQPLAWFAQAGNRFLLFRILL